MAQGEFKFKVHHITIFLDSTASEHCVSSEQVLLDLLSFNDRQYEMRRVLRMMEYCLVRCDEIRILLVIAACIQIAVEPRKVAARYGQCDVPPGIHCW